MSKPLVLLIALLIVSISSSAFAGQKYFSGFAGVNFPPGSDVIITPSGASDIVRVEGHDSNIMFGGAIGYDFANGLRIEEEVSYRNNDVNLASFNANPAIQGIEHTTLSFMTNGYLDMDLGIPVKPYLGVGIGFASIEREIRLTLGTDSDKDIVLAYQLMAGLGYKINPMFTITAGYRYFVTSGSRFTLIPVSAVLAVEDEFQSHEFIGGIRVSF